MQKYEKNKLKIVFEDDTLIVVNKDAGIITHSDSNNNDISLVNLLQKKKNYSK